jgi:hypothetical protein
VTASISSRLLLGEAEAVDLDAVAEAAELGVVNAEAGLADLVPEPRHRPHLAHLGDEADAGIDEEADAADDGRELVRRHLAARAHALEHGDGVGQRVGDLLHRRRARLLQVIAADIDRVPLGQFLVGESDNVGGQAEAGLGREDVCAA